MTTLTAYFLLCSSAFLSATLLPGSSEAVLLALLSQEKWPVLGLICVATLGNVAGALVNWGLGTYFIKFKDRRWFPLGNALNPRAQAWVARYGIWALLFSWVPLIGDSLTLVAGMMRVPVGVFLLFVTIGKLFRYLLVVGAWQQYNLL
jgi:membrane protein YqaA with SNARE-associated domain